MRASSLCVSPHAPPFTAPRPPPHPLSQSLQPGVLLRHPQPHPQPQAVQELLLCASVDPEGARCCRPPAQLQTQCPPGGPRGTGARGQADPRNVCQAMGRGWRQGWTHLAPLQTTLQSQRGCSGHGNRSWEVLGTCPLWSHALSPALRIGLGLLNSYRGKGTEPALFTKFTCESGA